MFTIYLPRSFKLGDTADCRINGEPRRITWRDNATLVIEPDDPRAIVAQQDAGAGLICFTCGNAGDGASDYGTELHPDGTVVGKR